MAVQKHTETVAEGVRIDGETVLVDFRWNGKRYRPTTLYKPTQKGIKAAAALRRQVKSEIKVGIFTVDQFAEYFPSHALSVEHLNKANPEVIEHLSFKDIAQEAITVHSSKVTPETLESYMHSLNRWWMPFLAKTPIIDIDDDYLESLDAELDWPSPKTRNNALVPLRFVFKKAMKKRIIVDGVKTRLITVDPSACLENGKPKKRKPDPYLPEERDLILAHLYQGTGLDMIWYHYFVVAFYTGLRIGELLALSWEQIDFRTGRLTVDRAYSKGRLKHTKTGEERDFPVHDIVLNSFTAMKAFTFLQSEHIFPQPGNLDKPLTKTSDPTNVFQKVLKKLGIRHRPTYNTRHTYATVMLMDDVKPGCAAAILGHSLQMFFTTYAKWIEGEATEKEIAKVTIVDPSEVAKKKMKTPQLKS